MFFWRYLLSNALNRYDIENEYNRLFRLVYKRKKNNKQLVNDCFHMTFHNKELLESQNQVIIYRNIFKKILDELCDEEIYDIKIEYEYIKTKGLILKEYKYKVYFSV